jgi:hypothetical protein
VWFAGFLVTQVVLVYGFGGVLFFIIIELDFFLSSIFSHVVKNNNLREKLYY